MLGCGCLHLGQCYSCGQVEIAVPVDRDGRVSVVLSSVMHTTAIQIDLLTGENLVIPMERLNERMTYEIKAFYEDGTKVVLNDGTEDWNCFYIETLPTAIVNGNPFGGLDPDLVYVILDRDRCREGLQFYDSDTEAKADGLLIGDHYYLSDTNIYGMKGGTLVKVNE